MTEKTPVETVQGMVDALNRLLESDHDLVASLVNSRFPCSPSVQTAGFMYFLGTAGPELGLLGVLNGLLAGADDGRAVIAVSGTADHTNRLTRITGFVNLMDRSTELSDGDTIG